MSTGGRVFPSVTGGGLGRATRAILDAELAAANRALQSRQLDIAERAQAINQFTTLAGFLEPGTTLKALGPTGMQLFSDAFGVESTGLEDLELSRETLETALNAAGVDLLQRPESELSLIRPGVRAQLGLEPSETVAEARDLDASVQLESARQILQNPEFTREFTLRRLGREPIEVRVPGVGGAPDKLVQFESELAAQIYADFLMGREGFGFRLSESQMTQGSEFMKTIREAVAESNFNVSDTALRGSVFPVYQAAVEANDPSVIQSFLESDATDGEKLALQYLVGSIGVGNDALIRGSSPRMANFLLIAADLEERFGVERANEILPSVLRSLGTDRFAQISDPLFFGPAVEVSGAEPAGAPGRAFQFFGDVFGTSQTRQARETDPTAGRRIDLSAFPDDQLKPAIEAVLSSGSMTREQIIAEVGADRFNRLVPAEVPPEKFDDPRIPEGGINPTSVPLPFRKDAERLNTLIIRRANTRSTIAQDNLTKAIEDLQTRIRDNTRRLSGG